MNGGNVMPEESNSVISGFIWRFAERCGAQGVSFLVSIILARILEPEVYGKINNSCDYYNIAGIC